MNRFLLTNLLLFLFCHMSRAQHLGFEFNPEIPVVATGGITLKLPWTGGLNFVQTSDIDFDFDGDMDLVFFDRSGDEIMLFENVTISGAQQYRFVQRGYLLFPEDARYRMALLDYNGDGKNDVFTYGIGGVKVYRNVGSASTGLQWELATSLIMSDYVGNYTNLYVSGGDIPAYVDVEGDGDIDILTFSVGGQQMEYHQNQSMDLYGNADSLVFVLQNECWGQFQEDLNNNALVLNSNIFPCGSGDIVNPQRPAAADTTTENAGTDEPTRHSGSTTLALDIDGNNVIDLVIGDVSYPSLVLLTNGGTAPNTNSPMISQQTNFPSNSVAANLQLFPASFYVDVDFDGRRDLIASPNAKTISQNQKSVQLYKNTGTDAIPVFTFQSKAFLQSEMIDAGLGAIPVLVDANGDGLQDLIVSSYFRYKEPLDKESAFNLYLNTGTATNPQFTDSDQDYLDMTTVLPALRLFPCFGDVDGDGDQDMLVGQEDGTLSLFTNTAGAGHPLAYSSHVNLASNTGSTIDVGYYSAPQLFDLDGDELLDLIVGRQSGELLYYRNTGTTTAPQFTLFNDHLGNIDISVGAPDGYAAPYFFRYHDTTLLFLGGYDGLIHYYNGIDGNLIPDSSFALVSNHYLDHNFGLYSSFAINDIDGDGELNLFAGHDLGGVQLFEVNPNSTLSLQEIEPNSDNYVVYPNPSSGTIHIKGNGEATCRIVSASGQVLMQTNVTGQATLDLSVYDKGVYLVCLQTGSTSEIHRVVLR